MKLSELLRRRSALAAQSSDLAAKAAAVSAELERIDSELFARMKSLVVAIEGGEESGSTVVSIDAEAIGHVAHQTASLFSQRPRYLRGVIADSGRKRESALGGHIKKALVDLGRPVGRNELYDRLQANGVAVPGKDPKANLSAHLSYMRDVERTPEGLWALKSEGSPA